MSLHSSFKVELKRFITISIVTVVVIIAQFWLWKFVAASANQLQEKRTQEDQLINLQDRIRSVEATFENQQLLLDQLEVIFPNRGATSQAVERLESLAESQGIELEIRSITENEKEALVELEVAVSAIGVAPQLLQYIDGVEHVSELTKIQKWSLEAVSRERNTSSDTSPDQDLYTLTMTIIFYMQAN